MQKWAGTHFSSTTLRKIGLRFQLGHHDGSICIHPTSSNTDFVVIHTNGIHSVSFDFCGCGPLRDRLDKQLLRVGWWPATSLKPKTCATFGVLKHFHLQNLQGHVSAFDFYRALELETDNTGTEVLEVRLNSSPNGSKILIHLRSAWQAL